MVATLSRQWSHSSPSSDWSTTSITSVLALPHCANTQCKASKLLVEEHRVTKAEEAVVEFDSLGVALQSELTVSRKARNKHEQG